MSIFSIFSGKHTVNDQPEMRSYFADALQFNSYSSYNPNRALLLSTVYRCVEVISDSVAQLPILTYFTDNNGFKKEDKGELSYILNKEPNSKMSRFTLMKLLVSNMLLKGNGYAYIDRKGGVINQLIYIPSEYVSIVENANDIMYKVVGVKDPIKSKDMIHLLNFSYDGVHGVSTLKHAAKTLGIAMDTEDSAEGFFKGGGNLAGIIQCDGSLTTTQKKNIKDSWTNSFSGSNGNPNGIAVLEGNMHYQPIQVSPAEAQMLDTRKFNTIEICRFFNVSPVKAFDFSNASYSTVEATQLAFLTDTLSPLLEKIELEFARKLFDKDLRNVMEVHFDTSVLLRTDKSSLADYFSKLSVLGVLSPNEIRKQLDMEQIEGGDIHTVQVNLVDINKLNDINYKEQDNRLVDDNNNDDKV